MPRQAAILEVLIASPSDVVEEREVLAQVVQDWNAAHSRDRGILLRALRWETDSVPDAGTPQETINKQLVETADILMGVFWHRLGTPTGNAPSGTAEEIERVRNKGNHVALYFSEKPIPYKHDAEQFRVLQEYRKARQADTLFATFADPEELRRLASRHLAWIVNKLSQIGTDNEEPRQATKAADVSGTALERLLKFRDDRLAAIRAGKSPISVPQDASKIVLHLVPKAALDRAPLKLDLAQSEGLLRVLLRPIGATGWDHRFNSSGFLTYSTRLGNYVQAFHSGAVEAIESNLLNMRAWREMTKFDGPDFISTTDLEDQMIAAVSTYAQAQQRIGVKTPIYVMLALLDVKGFRLTTSGTTFSTHAIDENDLLLPEVEIESFDADITGVLRPILDGIAQAAGLRGSRRYAATRNTT